MCGLEMNTEVKGNDSPLGWMVGRRVSSDPISILGWLLLWGWISMALGSQSSLAQESAGSSGPVTVEEVMAWLEEPPAISNMLGIRIKGDGGKLPTVPSHPVRSQEGVVDLHHLRWDQGKFFSRIFGERRDYEDPFAITSMASGGNHPNYWAITEGTHLTCIESEDILDRSYVGSWTEKSVATVLVVAAQKKIWEFLNLGLLRIRPGSIDWARDSGQFKAVSSDGKPLSGLLEITDDGVLEAIQYWHTDEPLPQVDLNDLPDSGESSQSFNAFRVSFFYNEQSKDWRIPSMFDVSYLVSVEKANLVVPTLPEGEFKAHGTAFLRYQVLELDRSEMSLPSTAFSHHQISEGERSPIDMRYTIYSNGDGHFRKTSAGSLIPLRTVTSENAARFPGQRGVWSRFIYFGIVVILGLGFFWVCRTRTVGA